jgi:hypothetical protein
MAAMAEAGVFEDEAIEDAMVKLVYVEMLYEVNLAMFDRHDRRIGGWMYTFPWSNHHHLVRK